jgi:transcriptional regulator with PAS, ATPase and Fis domain
MLTHSQLIGVSHATRQVLEDVHCAAVTDAKVLVTGESGVGKEVVAQLIHQRSHRTSAKLIAINCAGVPDSLLSSELFGHVRGSFTDAYRDKQGWLEQAHRGTIFMDEVGEMSLQMQAALLRFLENGEIQRVGSERRSAIVDVRIIAATNRRLIERVAAKEFREDLFYRLNVIHIEIPPLRERPDDVPALVDHFLQVFSATYQVDAPVISRDAMEQLMSAPWPGNVRQLKNVLERLVVNSTGRVITAADLPREVLSMIPEVKGADEPPARSNEDLFRRMVQNGESFWTAVHAPFIARDLTRDDVRAIVKEGLLRTRGGYKDVAALFNIPNDHRRLLSFLRKHNCHLPEQPMRYAPADLGHTKTTRVSGLEASNSVCPRGNFFRV